MKRSTKLVKRLFNQHDTESFVSPSGEVIARWCLVCDEVEVRFRGWLVVRAKMRDFEDFVNVQEEAIDYARHVGAEAAVRELKHVRRQIEEARRR